MRRFVRPVSTLLILAVLIWAGARVLPAQWARWFPKEKKEVFIPTAKARKGDLVISVKQIGNVEAENSLLVS